MTTYLIVAPNSQRVKIGQSANPKARLRQLQTASPERLELAAVLDHVSEAELHSALACYRTHGEWFETTLGLMAYLSIEHDIELGVKRTWREIKASAQA